MTQPKRKKAGELTSREAIQRIFGASALKELQKMAQEEPRKPKKQKRKPSNA